MLNKQGSRSNIWDFLPSSIVSGQKNDYGSLEDDGSYGEHQSHTTTSGGLAEEPLFADLDHCLFLPNAKLSYSCCQLCRKISQQSREGEMVDSRYCHRSPKAPGLGSALTSNRTDRTRWAGRSNCYGQRNYVRLTPRTRTLRGADCWANHRSCLSK